MAAREVNGRHLVAVADAKRHCVTLLQLNEFGAVANTTIWGDGVRGTFCGPIACTSLNEPVGLAFDGATLLIVCHGGEKHGSLVAVSPTVFACELLTQLHACFKASGFVGPWATAADRADRHLSMEQAIAMLGKAAAFFEAHCSDRSKLLSGHRGLTGPDGSLYWPSMRTLATSVNNVTEVDKQLRAAGVTNPQNMTVHALLDEGKVEAGFGEWVKNSSMDNPDQKEYARRKPALMRHALNKYGQPSFCHHESIDVPYQPSHCSQMETSELWQQISQNHAAQHPAPLPRAPAASRLATEWNNSRRFIALARHQRTGTTRSRFYKRKPGFSPDILLEGGEVEIVAEGAASRIASTFRRALDNWRAMRRGGAPSSQQQAAPHLTRADHLLLVGDVAFVAAGAVDEASAVGSDEDEGEEALEATVLARSELWWAIQATKAFERSKVHKRCVLKCFYLEAAGERRWRVVADEVSVFRGTLLVDPDTGEPFVLHGDTLQATWDGQQLQGIYSFPEELCEKLDEAAELHLRDDDDVESGTEEDQGSSDEEQSGDAEQQDLRAQDVRASQRADVRAARAETAELRQQGLQEVLVRREANRPDLAPASRPRRSASDQPWSRAAAWAAAGAGEFDAQ